MDQLAALEEVSQSENSNTIINFKSTISTSEETTINANRLNANEDNNSTNDYNAANEKQNVYEFHQSKIIAEQFGMIDDDSSSETTKTTTPVQSEFQSALQRTKKRMEEQKRKKELQMKQIEEEKPTTAVENLVTQKVQESVLTLETQQLQSSNSINSVETTSPLPEIKDDNKKAEHDNDDNDDDDDGDDDDDVIKTGRHRKPISSQTQDIVEGVDVQVGTDFPSKPDSKNHIEKEEDEDDDEDDDEIIKPTQKKGSRFAAHLSDNENETEAESSNAEISTHVIQKQIHNEPKAQPSTELDSLFVDDDDDARNDNQSEDELSSKIKNYQNMTTEQRYLARKLERSKLRNNRAKSKEPEDNDDLTQSSQRLRKLKERKPVMERIKVEKEKKQDLIRQNELLKLSIEKTLIQNPTKFTKNHLLHNLNLNSDSENDEDDPFFANNSLARSPPTSPHKEMMKLPIPSSILHLTKAKSSTSEDKIVTLDSASGSEQNDDSENEEDTSVIKKAKTLDVKLFFSKKRKNKQEKKQKSSFSDKIKKYNAKQLKGKLSSNSKKENKDSNVLTDDMLAKMLLDEQMRNSITRSKRSKGEESGKQQFPSHDDDPEFSEYSSDYEISSDEPGKYDSDDDFPPKAHNNEEPEENKGQSNAKAEEFKFSEGDGLENFNLSFTQLFDKTQTQISKSQEKLTVAEKFEKLKKTNQNIQDTQTQDYTEETTLEPAKLLTESSFLTKKLLKEDDTDISVYGEVVANNDDEKAASLKDMLDSQNLVLATQVDSISTQKLDAPVSISSTQDVIIVDNIGESTQQLVTNSSHSSNEVEKGEVQNLPVNNINIDHDNHYNNAENEDDDNDDDDDDEKIKIGRKNKMQGGSDDGVESVAEDDEEESEEMKHKRLALIKNAKKRERDLRRQREREFKAKGLGQVMENEAVESDDEYHGAGGIDKDLSDEENSEDEKLIDDANNIHIDETELRKIQLEKELKEDQEKVAKTYKDVKTHTLAARRAKDGVYAVDLSDDDDDEVDQLYKMREYIKKKKLKERQEFMEKNKVNLSDNDPKKPFFEAMNVDLPSHISIYKDSFTNSQIELNSDDDLNTNNIFATNDGSDYRDDGFQRPPLKKRKSSKNYSFGADDDIRFSSFKDQEYERARGDVLSGNDDDDDDIDGSKELSRLKKKSSVKLTRKLGVSKIPVSKAISSTDEIDNVDSFSLLSSKSNSITASFKKAGQKKVKISQNTGNIIRDVTVTTSAKSVTNSKAAVTKLTSSSSAPLDPIGVSTKPIKGSGIDRLDKMLAKTRKRGIKKVK